MRGNSRVVVLALAAVLVAVPALAQARRTRPGGGGSSAGGSRTHVTGRASYGHGGHGRGVVVIGHGTYPHGYRHFGYYGAPYFYGWPFWGWGFGWGGWYPEPVFRSATAGDPPGALVTRVRPKKAELRIDGQVVGQVRDFNGTWDRLWLEPGLYTLEFSRAGYQTLRVNVEVRPGLTVRLEERLQEGEGLDPRSHAPVTREAPPVATEDPGDRRVADTRLAPGAPQAPGLSSGFLRLDILPEDAAVYLDGAFLAQAGELRRMHGAIPVATGRHRLEIVRPGRVTVTRTVEVRAEATATVTIELERN